jgi:hypothetical protein
VRDPWLSPRRARFLEEKFASHKTGNLFIKAHPINRSNPGVSMDRCRIEKCTHQTLMGALSCRRAHNHACELTLMDSPSAQPMPMAISY